MKKKFQFFLVLFLTYSFMCCPVFGRVSYAAEEEEGQRPVKAFLQQTMSSIKSTAQFIIDSFPQWVEDYSFPTSLDDVKANMEKRKGIRNEILEKLGFPLTRSK
ncbi:MAG: hypothetical protein AB1611_03575 [bacterium]